MPLQNRARNQSKLPAWRSRIDLGVTNCSEARLINEVYGIPVIEPIISDLPPWAKLWRMAMFRDALKLQDLDPTHGAIEELERIYTLGLRFDKTLEACKESLVPQVAGMSSRWRMTTMLTAQKMQLSAGNHERIFSMYPRHASSFPYLRIILLLDHCKRSPHTWLDGFAAKWDDDIWKILKPPFGWECGCFLRMVSDDAVPRGVEPLQPAMERIPNDVVRAVIGWKATSPVYLWDRNSKPKWPHVVPENWRSDSARMGTAEKNRALLKSYGITVTTVQT